MLLSFLLFLLVVKNSFGFSSSSPRFSSSSPLSPLALVNEINFTLNPTESSLAYSYSLLGQQQSIQSLSRHLNTATNRALRQIVLSRSWPSSEVLTALINNADNNDELSRAKCPIPRPILKVIMLGKVSPSPPQQTTPFDPSLSLSQHIKLYRSRKDNVVAAEVYYECVLSLALEGTEGERINEVKKDIYGAAYARYISVLEDSGVRFVAVDDLNGDGRKKIKEIVLQESDFCLSILDKIRKEGDFDHDGDKILKKGIFGGIMALDDTISPATTNTKETPKMVIGDLLSSYEAPTVTAALNTLTNVVYRSLLYGGRFELTTLKSTLEAEKLSFQTRWPNDPAFQYLLALNCLLARAIQEGRISTLEPFVHLSNSYSNAYDRLVKKLLEEGSGFFEGRGGGLRSELPTSATEELGRFAMWESQLRSQQFFNNFPEDLVGSWVVTDEVDGMEKGTSEITLCSGGEVNVREPLRGLRWRLDQGPTHLDTLSFQIEGQDGLSFEYKGFLDRGARLETRFSGRRLKLKGFVSWQLRPETADYRRDILPIYNSELASTRFVMQQKEI